jgi:hypothetical protein
MGPAVAIRTAKHVPVVNEHGVVEAFPVLAEDGLAIVRMTCAHIEQPGKPEIGPIANLSKAVSGKKLEQPDVPTAQETRTETQACLRTKKGAGCLNPTTRVAFYEFTGDNQETPGRHRKTCLAVQLGSHTFIEKQVRPLEIVPELDHVHLAVTCFREDCLGSTAKFADILCDDRRFLPLGWHFSPKAKSNPSCAGAQISAPRIQQSKWNDAAGSRQNMCDRRTPVFGSNQRAFYFPISNLGFLL